jgi:hypothetical protein
MDPAEASLLNRQDAKDAKAGRRRILLFASSRFNWLGGGSSIQNPATRIREVAGLTVPAYSSPMNG